jgi:hypothetical protein
MRKVTYTAYAPDADMTFIMEDTYDENDNIISTECIGFYYGEPDDQLTEQYKGDLKAEYAE